MIRTQTTSRVRTNPAAAYIRKALDATTLALVAHGVHVHEFAHPGGGTGIDYLADGRTIAAIDDAHTEQEPRWEAAGTTTQVQLIRAHHQLYR